LIPSGTCIQKKQERIHGGPIEPEHEKEMWDGE